MYSKPVGVGRLPEYILGTGNVSPVAVVPINAKYRSSELKLF